MGAGSLSSAVEELPILLRPTVPGQLDTNTRITSIDNIDTELPTGIRTQGYLYYVEDVDKLYIFHGGLNNEHFVMLSTVLDTNISPITTQTINLVAGENEILHNLNTLLGKSEYIATFEYNNQPMLVDWRPGDTNGLNTGNITTIDSLSALNGVVVRFII